MILYVEVCSYQIPDIIPTDKLSLYKFSVVDQYAVLLRKKLQEEEVDE